MPCHAIYPDKNHHSFLSTNSISSSGPTLVTSVSELPRLTKGLFHASACTPCNTATTNKQITTVGSSHGLKTKSTPLMVRSAKLRRQRPRPEKGKKELG